MLLRLKFLRKSRRSLSLCTWEVLEEPQKRALWCSRLKQSSPDCDCWGGRGAASRGPWKSAQSSGQHWKSQTWQCSGSLTDRHHTAYTGAWSACQREIISKYRWPGRFSYPGLLSITISRNSVHEGGVDFLILDWNFGQCKDNLDKDTDIQIRIIMLHRLTINSKSLKSSINLLYSLTSWKKFKTQWMSDWKT